MFPALAPVAELVDATDSKSVVRKGVLVRVRPGAPTSPFKNFGHASNMLFELIFEDGHWRIDDVVKRLKPRWTMSKILMDAPDAFPDAAPDDSSDVR